MSKFFTLNYSKPFTHKDTLVVLVLWYTTVVLYLVKMDETLNKEKDVGRVT